MKPQDPAMDYHMRNRQLNQSKTLASQPNDPSKKINPIGQYQ